MASLRTIAVGDQAEELLEEVASTSGSDESIPTERRRCTRRRGIQFAFGLVLVAAVAWLGLAYVKSQAAGRSLARALNGEDIGTIELDLDFNDGKLALMERAGRTSPGHRKLAERFKKAADVFARAHGEALRQLHANISAPLPAQGGDAPLRSTWSSWASGVGSVASTGASMAHGGADLAMKHTLSLLMSQMLDQMNDQVVENANKQDPNDVQMPKRPGDPNQKVDSISGPESMEFTSFKCTDYYSQYLENGKATAWLQLKGHFNDPLVVHGRIPMGQNVDQKGILVYPFETRMKDITMCACHIKANLRFNSPNPVDKFEVNHVDVGIKSIDGTIYSKYEHAKNPDGPPTQVSNMETGIMRKRLQEDLPKIREVYSKQFHDNMQKQMDEQTQQGK